MMFVTAVGSPVETQNFIHDPSCFGLSIIFQLHLMPLIKLVSTYTSHSSVCHALVFCQVFAHVISSTWNIIFCFGRPCRLPIQNSLFIFPTESWKSLFSGKVSPRPGLKVDISPIFNYLFVRGSHNETSGRIFPT